MTPIEKRMAVMLGEYAAYPADKITTGTRVYHNAGLAGDDLYEFAVRLHNELGVTLPAKLTAYAPGEVRGFGLRDLFPWCFKYQELSVGQLAALATLER